LIIRAPALMPATWLLPVHVAAPPSRSILDPAALRFPHHLLGAGDALAGDELQRTEAGPE
jgi:hypothetical protein